MSIIELLLNACARNFYVILFDNISYEVDNIQVYVEILIYTYNKAFFSRSLIDIISYSVWQQRNFYKIQFICVYYMSYKIILLKFVLFLTFNIVNGIYDN